MNDTHYIHDGGGAQGPVMLPASATRHDAANLLAVASDRVEATHERSIAANAAIACALLDLADAVRGLGGPR
jgi:hypothetical protein